MVSMIKDDRYTKLKAGLNQLHLTELIRLELLLADPLTSMVFDHFNYDVENNRW